MVSSLEKIGLAKNEIKVYFALLELGRATATPIVKKASIPNSKIYPVLESLIGKGLVSYSIENNVKHFQASNPAHILNLVREREEELARQKEELKNLVKNIETRRKIDKGPQEVKLYEGFKGMKKCLLDNLYQMKKGEEYQVFSFEDELKLPEIMRFFHNYHAKRVELGINVRLIAPKRFKKLYKELYLYDLFKVKFSEKHPPAATFIFKNSVITFVYGTNPSAFVMTSKQVADRYRKFFEDAWNQAVE